ncbi:MAG: bifunctional hydroxymethylpyrimidine kinase/phosphomethylpyrimidine kinase [Bacteroidales bacterium]|nr:bifunctional hydroxymethylpyrimidine kinase/phosphomethylpyrimidine kinase [Bacteroidales bacterium]
MKKDISVLTIAGSDSIAGAGIQADIKTISALGLYACSCITSVTAQNTLGVKNIQAIDNNIVSQQIDAVFGDVKISAVKIGMIYTKENVMAIKQSLLSNNYNGHIVLDPVLVATSGDSLAKEDFLSTLKKELFPLCSLLTPNIHEAEKISNCKINTVEDMVKCGQSIIKEYNVKNVLIKGGHSNTEDMTDVLVYENMTYDTFSAKKIISKNTHGTGCTLSSAIASYLAMGNTLKESVKQAKEYVYQAILFAKDNTMFSGHGALEHFYKIK